MPVSRRGSKCQSQLAGDRSKMCVYVLRRTSFTSASVFMYEEASMRKPLLTHSFGVGIGCEVWTFQVVTRDILSIVSSLVPD